MRFVSLHTHTTFSTGDGFGTVSSHVERVAELGMSALALTEHG
ncbi:MAG TPA: PHP domain-containing protein [Nitrosomonas sp.]|nr:PHP domain-containing protein [Nitrosomonas sp.]HNJ38172.1 PHP domain-containing protein [Nitrosomonas sp.]HNK88459.1 PHP domain-containing protein [Nitrosomonas sp.]